MMKTNGHLLSGLPIAVDYWKLPKYNEECQTYVYFLSHMHTDHTSGLTSTWPETVYTSKVNSQLAQHMLGLPKSRLVELELDVPHVIKYPGNRNENIGETFQVTLISSNHIAGSVMFLFQGSFGNILYTADFRYCKEMLVHSTLQPLISQKALHKLYVDNTYNEEGCDFPSREKAVEEVLCLVRKFPEHRIIFGCHTIGKEQVLVRVAMETRERIYVPPMVHDIYRLLELPDVFTTNQRDSRIWFETVNRLYMHKQQLASTPTIIIVLSALPLTGRLQGLRRLPNVHIVPYSNHSCYSELREFLSKIQAKQIRYIVNPNKLFSDSQKRKLQEKRKLVPSKDEEARPVATKRRRDPLTEENCSADDKNPMADIRIQIAKLNSYLDVEENSVRSPGFKRMLCDLLNVMEPTTGVKGPQLKTV